MNMAPFKQIQQTMQDENPEALFAGGFEAALIGPLRRCGQPTVCCYSYKKAVKVLMDRDGMSLDDALEWMEVNVVGAWYGPNTPAWLADWPTW